MPETNNEMLGELVTKVMDDLEEHYPGMRILEAGVVVILDDEQYETTITRTCCTSALHYRNVGMFELGLDAIKTGNAG